MWAKVKTRTIPIQRPQARNLSGINYWLLFTCAMKGINDAEFLSRFRKFLRFNVQKTGNDFEMKSKL